jgi:hypothetical protein
VPDVPLAQNAPLSDRGRRLGGDEHDRHGAGGRRRPVTRGGVSGAYQRGTRPCWCAAAFRRPTTHRRRFPVGRATERRPAALSQPEPRARVPELAALGRKRRDGIRRGHDPAGLREESGPLRQHHRHPVAARWHWCCRDRAESVGDVGLRTTGTRNFCRGGARGEDAVRDSHICGCRCGPAPRAINCLAIARYRTRNPSAGHSSPGDRCAAPSTTARAGPRLAGAACRTGRAPGGRVTPKQARRVRGRRPACRGSLRLPDDDPHGASAAQGQDDSQSSAANPHALGLRS